jgi:hypothetical protein
MRAQLMMLAESALNSEHRCLGPGYDYFMEERQLGGCPTMIPFEAQVCGNCEMPDGD